jgi:hypothetical protein
MAGKGGARLGGDAIEKVLPLSKGPYNTSSHFTYPESMTPYRITTDSTPLSQKHSLSGASINEHPFLVTLRKQFISPNNRQN